MTWVYMTMPPTIPTQNYTKTDTSAHEITAKTSGITGGLVKLSLWNLQISLVQEPLGCAYVDERVH